jgi:hypothetical protein
MTEAGAVTLPTTYRQSLIEFAERLGEWGGDLGGDIQRARDRGHTLLAADLCDLQRRIELLRRDTNWIIARGRMPGEPRQMPNTLPRRRRREELR